MRCIKAVLQLNDDEIRLVGEFQDDSVEPFARHRPPLDQET